MEMEEGDMIWKKLNDIKKLLDYGTATAVRVDFWFEEESGWTGEMASVVKNALKALRQKGIGNFIRELREEGYTKCFFDGNLLQTKLHNIGATLVGVDKFGNKYYQKLGDTQYGRHRWVEYAQKGRYNASQVPPEWHGWLHFITDHTGDELLLLKPKRYGVEHKENFSGEGDEYIYHSKGHSLNRGQRDWTRYQPWQPTKP